MSDTRATPPGQEPLIERLLVTPLRGHAAEGVESVPICAALAARFSRRGRREAQKAGGA